MMRVLIQQLVYIFLRQCLPLDMFKHPRLVLRSAKAKDVEVLAPCSSLEGNLGEAADVKSRSRNVRHRKCLTSPDNPLARIWSMISKGLF